MLRNKQILGVGKVQFLELNLAVHILTTKL
jgi:hypothetical protein